MRRSCSSLARKCVDLVGAELRATMADLCEIGFCVVLRTADAKNRMPVMLVAAHEEVNRWGAPGIDRTKTECT